MRLAPVILFTYRRLGTLRETVAALKKNELCSETDLFIFSDGAKSSAQEEDVSRIRDFLKNIDGFQSVSIYESLENKGLGQSIISGVSEIMEKFDRVIVLEDDLVTSTNFLVFMNKALDYYEDNVCIHSISGYSFRMRKMDNKSVYFTQRASSWGWGSWKNRWTRIDWNVKDYDSFKSSKMDKRKFNAMGSDMTHMLSKQMKGKIDSWAIRWCFHQFRNNLFTVYPAVSKVKNIGMGEGATNTRDNFGRFDTIMDNSGVKDFDFVSDPALDGSLIKQFMSNFSIYNRVKYKILNAIR